MINTDTLQITPEILSLISTIDEFKGTWSALKTLAPERLLALRKVATIESIGSSTRIEGSQLSDREVEKLLSNIEIKLFETRDEQEVAGYAKVMDTIYFSWEYIHITENYICQLHKDLLCYSQKDEWHRGKYKTSSNSVAAFDEDGKEIGVIFKTATPFDTPQYMQELLNWYNKSIQEKRLHPLIITGIFIVVFLEIHPFQDGNGRLSRILTILLLLKSGYIYVPYSSLESIVENSKEAYYQSLRRTQRTIRTDTPSWHEWLLFFLKTLQKQAQHLRKKVEQEKRLVSNLPKLSVDILDHVQQHGRITMSDAVIITGVSRNTLKVHFRNLLKKGLLILNGQGRGAWYGLP